MRETKDSGIQWIGQIPTDWKIEKVKHHFRTTKTIPGALSRNYNRLSLTLRGVIPRAKDDCDGLQPKDFDTYQLLRENELVFKLIDLQNVSTSRVGLSHDTGLVSPAYIVLHENGDVIPAFAEKYFLMLWYRQIFNALGDNGVRSNLNSADLLNIPICVPRKKIQEDIVRYLDNKCSQIDALLTEIQFEIDALEEYKKTVITDAVTKGLNPDAEMHDSGTAWCPQVPKQWRYTNPKALFRLRDDRAIPNERQLTASQEHGIVYQDEYMEMTGNRVVTVQKDFSILKHVEPNDFVISMRSFQGGLEYSEKRGCISSAYVMLIPNQDLVYAPFYRWFFKSSKYINAIQSTSNLVRDGQAMRYANFVQVPLFIVPIEEQKEIAAYLDEKVSNIDAVIKEKQEMLDTLAEYKKSLIYEYVTGKKEVPTVNDDVVVLFDPNALWLGFIADKLGKNQRGRTQIQKIKYLLDIHCGINPTKQYYRYNHGPYDVNLNAYLDSMVEQRWFKQERDGTITLTAGECHGDFQNICKDQLGEHEAVIDGFLSLLQSMNVMKTRRLERIATLYAVWNDFLLDGITPTDEQIIQEVLTNWTENKKHFKYDTWQDSLNKMKEHGLIPKGTGLHTLPKPEKDGE